MLNKLAEFIREYRLIFPGERVICAVSGGADSVALLLGLYLLREKLEIRLEAAHFNHQLRGEESDGDELFVRTLCDRYEIPLHLGTAPVKSGKKGLEAAARDARYGFLRGLPGKVATAHTADDNAETVLMHLLRGTGLKGLGGIAPQNGSVIRPMLSCTRQEVEAFLEEYCLSPRFDSSNASDAFLRNRLRRTVVPELKKENPRFSAAVSRMALDLRQDEDLIRSLLPEELPGMAELRTMHPALRSRLLERFLKENGVPEPEQTHIAALDALVFSQRPSARAELPGGITIGRSYDRLVRLEETASIPEQPLKEALELPYLGLAAACGPAESIENSADTFTVIPSGPIRIRSRLPGDQIRLSGGTKSLKKLFIDRKIPAHLRSTIPVIADDLGVLGVYGIGPNLDRTAKALPALTIRFRELP